MNLALEYFADNPIIDELVCWPPRKRKIIRLRAASALFRQPFIEIEMEDGELIHRHFERLSFARYWAEACVILGAITGIELVSEFEPPPVEDAEDLRRRVFEARDECIDETNPMFDEGMYEQFLMQYGLDCKDLPEATQDRLVRASAALAARS